MCETEYVKSKKIWQAPRLDAKSSGLGEEILEKLNQCDPEKVYEILHDSSSHVTVKDIHDQTITVTQNLWNLGVKKGDTVVFFTMLNLKITPLLFACYTIGAPVCFFEVYLKEDLIPHYLELLDPAVIMYEDKYKSLVLKALRVLNLSHLKHLLCLNGREDKSVDELLFKPIVDIENFQVPHIADPNVQPAILAFTSGTTGRPKIIKHSHAMMRQSIFSRWQAKPGNVVMILSEIRWLCQISIMMQPAFLNVKRVYSSTPPKELTGEFVKEIIDTHKVTHYFEVPRFFQTVLEAAEKSKDPLSLNSLKLALLGGENAAEAFETNVAKINPNCKIGRCYGMTEMAGAIASSELASRQNVNGGVCRKGCMVKILDKNNNNLGPNEMGRICLKTPAPFLGYLKNQKANQEAFIEGGWFNTGDLGLFDSDNLLNIFTRENYALRYGNGRILIPNEIENIVDKFETVHLSVLDGKPSIENPKEDCGTIFVVLKKSAHSIYIENDLRDFLRRKLTQEQLQIVKYFKVMEDLPKTSCFKIDKVALKEMFEGSCRI